jgi:hypothetical protein
MMTGTSTGGRDGPEEFQDRLQDVAHAAVQADRQAESDPDGGGEEIAGEQPYQTGYDVRSQPLARPHLAEPVQDGGQRGDVEVGAARGGEPPHSEQDRG